MKKIFVQKRGGKDMSDRRMGDRRTPDKGMLVIPFKDAVIYIVIATIMIISVTANVILLNRNKQYKDLIESYYYDDEDIEYEDEIEETE